MIVQTTYLTQRVSHNLSAVWHMNYNYKEQQFSNCPNMLEYWVRDGGGAQEEPYMCVWSTHVQPGNTWTGCGPLGLAAPAQVSETPNHISHKAKDTDPPGRGLCESDTDPFKSLSIKAEEILEENKDENKSSDESSTYSEDKTDTPEAVNKASHKQKANIPKKRPGLKIALLNMRGHQKEGKDK